MSELTAVLRRELKARAHHLKPVVLIGQHGLSAGVHKEINAALKIHELIKVRLSGERQERLEAIDTIVAESGAQSVQQIGRLIVLWRPKPAEEISAEKVKAAKTLRRKPAVKSAAAAKKGSQPHGKSNYSK